MSILPKMIYRFKGIPIKTPAGFCFIFFCRKADSKMQMTEQLRKRTRRNYTTNFKNYSKAKVIKTVCYWIKNRHLGQQNRKVSLEIDTHIHSKLIFNKGAKVIQ